MSVLKKTEELDEIKRIRVHGLSDARRLMEEYDIPTLAGFFVIYESKNQELLESEALSRMRTILDAMRGTLREGLEHPNRTPSGMIDGGAAHMEAFIQGGESLVGNQFSTVIRNTLAAAENNACMGRIVAAPTAGASGVLPSAYLTIADAHHVAEERIVQGLFVAGGIGECIALQASLSGSQHGCQAENGSASAEMALAGIRTVVPFDEVVQAMDHIGRDMSSSLKETSLGGLAATPTTVRIAAEFKRMRP
jgi:L-serine dehydratase